MRHNWLATLAFLAAMPAWADPRFSTVDMPEHSYSGGWEHYVGGGIAAFDCNGDTLPELFAAGGEAPSTLFRNQSAPGGPLRFTATTPDDLHLTSVIGAYPLDIDSDGILDLVVLRNGENRLLRGGADCSFAPFTNIGFASTERWTTAFSATWEAGQTLPTLAFGNYVDRNDPKGPFRTCDDTILYRPVGNRYETPVKLSPGHCALSMLFSDWGRHGRADLRISNDRHYYVDTGAEQMWAMEPAPRLYTADEGWKPYHLWGMGIASRDLTGDGRPEVFLTSMGDQRLQLPNGTGPSFVDAPFSLGTTAHRPYTGGDGRPSTGWHVAFGDVNNDGRDDIFVSKGNVEQMPDSAMDDPNNLLIQRPDGHFVEFGEAAGVASLHRGRGAVLADLNADGLLDLAVNNRRAPLELWQNVTPDTGTALRIDLRHPAPNTRAIGAWIELRTNGVTQSREITVGGGHAGGSATAEHFGIGSATEAAIRVIWPDGTPSRWIKHTVTGTSDYIVLDRTIPDLIP